MPTRRDLLKAFTGLVASGLPLISTNAGSSLEKPQRHFATARTPDGHHQLIRLDGTGAQPLGSLPGRGHGLVLRPTGADLVVMARRPGDWGLVVDRGTGATGVELRAPEGFHFYGHAAFSPDGRYLLTTENHFAAMAEDERTGRIGIWDAEDGYRRIKTVETATIGPHDVARDPVRGGYWVANGGILTHPDTGRTKLNIPDMKPSVSWIGAGLRHDPISLELPPSLHKLGIRHIDVSPSGVVACAMQYEGPPGDPVPLVAVVDASDTLRPFEMPASLAGRAHGYCGDVALDATGSVLGAGFPRGGFFNFWDTATGASIGFWDMEDGCGIVGDGIGFVATGGLGDRTVLTVGDAVTRSGHRRSELLEFDNHLV